MNNPITLHFIFSNYVFCSVVEEEVGFRLPVLALRLSFVGLSSPQLPVEEEEEEGAFKVIPRKLMIVRNCGRFLIEGGN